MMQNNLNSEIITEICFIYETARKEWARQNNGVGYALLMHQAGLLAVYQFTIAKATPTTPG